MGMANEIYSANRTTIKYVLGDWSFYSWTDCNGNKMGLGVLRYLNMIKQGALAEMTTDLPHSRDSNDKKFVLYNLPRCR